MYPWMVPPTPAPSPTVGRQYRRKQDTLTWELVAIDHHADELKMRGPGERKGIMCITIRELQSNWITA